METPEKIWVHELSAMELNVPMKEYGIKYTRTDAFIEKALKWYCLDCACNDNCTANHKCAFRYLFEMYLEGNDKALPPKISNAFNPDGSTTENYRYRHIIERMQDDFIEKACEWLNDWFTDDSCRCGIPITKAAREEFFNEFKNSMKGE